MSALVTVAVPVALVFSVRALMRVDTVAGRGSTLDVIADCCETLALRWSWSARLFGLVTHTWTEAVERMPSLMSWVEMRRHPWRSAVAISVAAGVALKAPDLLKGDVDVPAAAVEAAAAFVGYCLFGRLLGLRGLEGRNEISVGGEAGVEG